MVIILELFQHLQLVGFHDLIHVHLPFIIRDITIYLPVHISCPVDNDAKVNNGLG